MKNLTEQKTELIHIAAELLKCRLPEYRDDYPSSVPKYVIEGIKQHNEGLRVMAIDVRNVADSLSANRRLKR